MRGGAGRRSVSLSSSSVSAAQQGAAELPHSLRISKAVTIRVAHLLGRRQQREGLTELNFSCLQGGVNALLHFFKADTSGVQWEPEHNTYLDLMLYLKRCKKI